MSSSEVAEDLCLKCRGSNDVGGWRPVGDVDSTHIEVVIKEDDSIRAER